MRPTVRVVIPARLQSTRLPHKPLIEIAGVPMIVRTYEQCAKVFNREMIVVATDAPEIEAACNDRGIGTIMTSTTHLTGTDRVAEVASRLPADVYINVQGDEPLFDPQDLQIIYDHALNAPNVIANGYCSIRDEEEFTSRMTPKVVFDGQGKLLYMSRAPIPAGKEARFQFGYRQVCAYAFPAQALDAFAKHPGKTPLEQVEDIEILRLLELGHTVQMLAMSDNSIPVDTPHDVMKVEAALAKHGPSVT